MAQIEYNDLNKFYVSIGITLLALTFVLPWLYMKEKFDLLITIQDLNKYTDTAQTIIKRRQFLVGLFSIIIPCVSAISFSFGFYLTYQGLKRWRPIQILIEQREKLTNEIQILSQEQSKLANQKLILEITTLSQKEKEDKVDKEVKEIEAEVSVSKSGDRYSIEDFKEKYLLNEKKFQKLLEKTIDGNFKIYPNAKIGDKEFDLILSSLDYDYVVEVKYTDGIVTQKYLREVISDMQARLSFYQENVKQRTKARLVFLVTKEALRQKGYRDTNLDYKLISLIDYQNQNLRRTNTFITYFEVDRFDGYIKEDVLEKLKV